MANNNFQKQALDLLSPICMDINDSVVRPFDSFNKKNCPYIGDQLSPFYLQQDKAQSGEATPVYDNQGNRWSIINNRLCKNGVSVNDNLQLDKSFIRTKIEKREYIAFKYYEATPDAPGRWIAFFRERKIIGDQEYSQFYYQWLGYSGWDPVQIGNTYKGLSFGNLFNTDSDSLYFCLVYVDQRNEAYLNIDIYTNNSNLSFYKQATTLIDNPKSFSEVSWVSSISSKKRLGDLLCFSLVPLQGTGIKYLDTRNFCFNLKTRTVYQVYMGNHQSKPKEDSNYKRFYFINGGPFGIAFYCGDYAKERKNTGKPVNFWGTAIFEDYISLKQAKDELTHQDVFWYDIYIPADYFHTYTDNDILDNNESAIKKLSTTAYTVYPNYYQQCTVIKKNKSGKDIFVPLIMESGSSYPSLEAFSGANINTPEITPDTVPSCDLPTLYTLTLGSFEVALNNGYPSAVISDNGNLITPWNDLDGEPLKYASNAFVYKSTDGNYYEVEKKKEPEIKTIINNRYVLINSDSIFNVYDIEKDNWYNWTNGYNGNLRPDLPYIDITSMTQEQKDNYGAEFSGVTLVAASYNANYEITKIPFPATLFPPTRLRGLYITGTEFYAMDETRELDIYISKGEESIVPKYAYSRKRGRKFIKAELLNVLYPGGSIYYSLSLMADILKSYNNHDFVIENGNGYPLVYSNNNPVFSYDALSFIEGIKGTFVIQNSNYMLFQNKILAVQYNGTQILGNTVVCDVTGMEFIGNTSQVAFFYSKLAKKIYTFTGDVVLREQRGANVIDEVYGSFFIPADNTIIISCREYDGIDYVYFFGADSFLKIENTHVKNCFYGDNKIILVDVLGNANKYSYFKISNSVKIPIELQTGFFGIGNEMNAVLDCWYIRVFDDTHSQAKITVQQNVLTNIGKKIEKKEIVIKPSDWDELSHSYLIRYQPRYQNGVGFQLSITSDVAIYEILASYRQGDTQLTSKKAQI